MAALPAPRLAVRLAVPVLALATSCPPVAAAALVAPRRTTPEEAVLVAPRRTTPVVAALVAPRRATAPVEAALVAPCLDARLTAPEPAAPDLALLATPLDPDAAPFGLSTRGAAAATFCTAACLAPGRFISTPC